MTQVKFKLSVRDEQDTLLFFLEGIKITHNTTERQALLEQLDLLERALKYATPKLRYVVTRQEKELSDV